ncbi:MAG: NAD(P)/FAD-dependent oxidoreductase [Proteobacteria bacterium]|nr:NAD(P)/FAD-dependent oxidoreductase [Pseudomonadota bacterium]MDA1057735.1 NAD(P)/FAD-dependent oxidoreductase [Pseudomonadota bacterium]
MSTHPRYPHLFSPLRLGPVELKNRATMAAHGMRLGDDSGVVSPRHRAYIVARAKGGAALVSASSLPVHPTSQTFAGLQIRTAGDDLIPSLSATADEVHAAGSKLAITLWHGGYNVTWLAGRAAVGPSAVANSMGQIPKVLSIDEIAEIVAAYGAAARRCRDAGVDVLEVQTSTDYLLGSFLSPVINRRTDTYGGSFENRLRIVCEVLAAVRENAGASLAVGIRTSIAHHMPGADEDYDAAASLASVRALQDDGLLDYVSLMSGSYRAAAQTIPTMDQPRAVLADAAQLFTDELKIPVIVANRIRTAQEAEDIVAGGAAHAIAMARTWIADPDWAKKYEAGEDARVRPCVSCSQACQGFLARGLRVSCIGNPVAGREVEFPEIGTASVAKDVAIIGGGPAGLESARLAALRGHRVTVYEASSRLGGQLALAAAAPHRAEMGLLVDWWARELDTLGVVVRLDHAIDPHRPPAAGAVIWAIGAQPSQSAVGKLRPALFDGIPGSSGLAHGRDVIAGINAATGKVLVLDEEGGWPAVSLAETLAAQTGVSSVTVATTEAQLGLAELSLTRELPVVTARLRAAGVTVVPGVTASHVGEGIAVLKDGPRLGRFNTIMLSTGTSARPTPEGALAVGDCVAPRSVWAATNDALALVSRL